MHLHWVFFLVIHLYKFACATNFLALSLKSNILYLSSLSVPSSLIENTSLTGIFQIKRYSGLLSSLHFVIKVMG